MNYLLPLKGVLSMHCYANVGKNDETALFFSLSGTGKTTLSADPNRGLIGDDEHGWSDEDIFNFEGGCYAKVIQLSETAEPEIYACTHMFGTILENVVLDPITRLIDLNDDKFTENTRASYPLEYITNAIPEKTGGHPKNIVLLTCDAQGVMHPIARLTSEQAMYHFISGYTSKIGDTESGMGKDPEITFSASFGGLFMVHSPLFYADLLKKKILRYDVDIWRLNIGWVGGPYGIGKRISIRYTRDLLNAALTGALHDVEYHKDPIFGYLVPKSCSGLPENILKPAGSWPNQAQYDNKYIQLAVRFIENFRKFEPESPLEVVQAGPKI
jgi:phosphoenolpyruvate carboxykinase (ATP)